MQRSDLFTIKSISMVGSVSLAKTLNTASMAQLGKVNDDGDDDVHHHHQYCHRVIYIHDRQNNNDAKANQRF